MTGVLGGKIVHKVYDMAVLFVEIEPDDSSSARCFQRGRHAHLGNNELIAIYDAPLISKVNNFGKNIVARLFLTNELLLREVYWPPVLPEKYIIS